MEDVRDAALAVRRRVLGDEYVDRAMGRRTDFDQALQDFVLDHCWGAVWTRPGLDPRTRSMLNVAMLAATGHHNELRIHVTGALRNGCTVDEIKEILLQVGVYAGTPAAVSAFGIAREAIAGYQESAGGGSTGPSEQKE